MNLSEEGILPPEQDEPYVPDEVRMGHSQDRDADADENTLRRSAKMAARLPK